MLKELEISDPTQLDFQLPVGMKSQVKNEIQNKKNILIKLENYYINNSLQHIEKFEKYNLENFKLIAKKILDFDEEDLSLEEINQFHNEYKDLKDKIPKEMQTSIDFNIHLIINLKNSIKKSQIN
jgi:prefoldin subunit 5